VYDFAKSGRNLFRNFGRQREYVEHVRVPTQACILKYNSFTFTNVNYICVLCLRISVTYTALYGHFSEIFGYIRI
jgi:hypothetical protein